MSTETEHKVFPEKSLFLYRDSAGQQYLMSVSERTDGKVSGMYCKFPVDVERGTVEPFSFTLSELVDQFALGRVQMVSESF